MSSVMWRLCPENDIIWQLLHLSSSSRRPTWRSPSCLPTGPHPYRAGVHLHRLHRDSFCPALPQISPSLWAPRVSSTSGSPDGEFRKMAVASGSVSLLILILAHLQSWPNNIQVFFGAQLWSPQWTPARFKLITSVCAKCNHFHCGFFFFIILFYKIWRPTSACVFLFVCPQDDLLEDTPLSRYSY